MNRLFEEINLANLNGSGLKKPKLVRQISIPYMHNGEETYLDPMSIKDKESRLKHLQSYKDTYGFEEGAKMGSPGNPESNQDEVIPSLKLNGY